VYHIGLYVEGAYCPEHGAADTGHHSNSNTVHEHDQGHHPGQGGTVCGPDCALEHYTRLLTASAAMGTPAAG
jgi:hypothetical protein